VSTTLQTKLPDDLAEAFKTAAERSGLTVSMWLRAAGEARLIPKTPVVEVPKVAELPGPDPAPEVLPVQSESRSTEPFCNHPLNHRQGNGICSRCGKEA